VEVECSWCINAAVLHFYCHCQDLALKPRDQVQRNGKH